jgi:phospholipid/cholesterol/gamma-HCH transport system permease protein
MKYVISKKVDSFFTDVNDVFGFVIRFFKEVFKPPFEFNEIIKQCYNVGVRSVALITVTGFITGLVFTKQSRPSLAEFGATSWLPSLVGIAVIKSLAPLVTALICAGKVGSGIGAELGSMKVTEQIDAMDVSGVNAFKFLVVTRIVATSLCIPLLMMYAAFVSLMGSYIDIHSHENITLLTFFQNAFQKITFLDFCDKKDLMIPI